MISCDYVGYRQYSNCQHISNISIGYMFNNIGIYIPTTLYIVSVYYRYIQVVSCGVGVVGVFVSSLNTVPAG